MHLSYVHSQKRPISPNSSENVKKTKKFKRRNFICDFCQMRFGASNTLYKHVATVHERKKTLSLYENCQICGNGYTSKQALKEHVLKDHKKEIPLLHDTFKCKICGLKFSLEDDLNKHISKYHEDSHCKICDLKFSLKADLNKHISQFHEDIQFCPICYSNFEGLGELNQHIKQGDIH